MSQTIIVTGASAGIGLAIAKFLLSSPSKHRLIVCCNSNNAPLKSLANEPSNVNRVFIVKGDMADSKFVDTILAQSLLHFEIDRVDALVLNHGTLGECTRLADMKLEEWEAVFRVNVGSYVAMVRLEARRECGGRG
jgi:NAD(P)-dependent dehydrogenase (short-subunit alcohol dehydrogenase family)